MINLIKNEFTKIFGKTSFYVLLLTISAVIIFNTFMFKNMEPKNTYYENEYSNAKYIEEDLQKLEKDGKQNTEKYADLKTDLEVIQVEEQNEEEWKHLPIIQHFRSLATEINNLIYVEGYNKDTSKELKELINEKETMLQKLKENNWEYFCNRDIKIYKDNIELCKTQLLTEENKDNIKQLNLTLSTYQMSLEECEYRINNKVVPDNGFLDKALGDRTVAATMISAYESSYFEKSNSMENYENKKTYYTNVEDYHINQYIIENKVNANSTDDTKALIKGIFDNYGLFIIILILIYASNIVSEEFNKGTIKLLLVRPHRRTKILLSKLLTVILLIPLTIIFVVFVQLIIGGILSGFDSLQNPVVVYDHNQNVTLAMNVFKYIAIESIYMMPLLLLLVIIAFGASTILNNTALALAGTLLLYMGGTLINKVAQFYNIESIKYFITMNWDIKQYIFGRLPETEFTTFPFSLAICIIYFIAIMFITITNFKRKNIKNI